MYSRLAPIIFPIRSSTSADTAGKWSPMVLPQEDMSLTPTATARGPPHQIRHADQAHSPGHRSPAAPLPTPQSAPALQPTPLRLPLTCRPCALWDGLRRSSPAGTETTTPQREARTFPRSSGPRRFWSGRTALGAIHFPTIAILEILMDLLDFDLNETLTVVVRWQMFC